MTQSLRSELIERGWSTEAADAIVAHADTFPDGFIEARFTPGVQPQIRKRKPRPAISSADRWAVWEADNFTCRHCGIRRYLTIDHVVPLARGGQHKRSNFQTLCSKCNNAKGAH